MIKNSINNIRYDKIKTMSKKKKTEPRYKSMSNSVCVVAYDVQGDPISEDITQRIVAAAETIISDIPSLALNVVQQ